MSKTITIGKLKVGKTFKYRDHETLYYVRGEYDKGSKTYPCKCYTSEHKRWAWMDRHLKKDRQVFKFNRE